MPPAPGWFSTTIGAASAFESAGCAARVIVSTPEAVATGRMNLTGREHDERGADQHRAHDVENACERRRDRRRRGHAFLPEHWYQPIACRASSSSTAAVS